MKQEDKRDSIDVVMLVVGTILLIFAAINALYVISFLYLAGMPSKIGLTGADGTQLLTMGFAATGALFLGGLLVDEGSKK